MYLSKQKPKRSLGKRYTRRAAWNITSQCFDYKQSNILSHNHFPLRKRSNRGVPRAPVYIDLEIRNELIINTHTFNA